MIELIFIHIPKTGGRSFKVILQSSYGYDKVFRIENDELKKPDLNLKQLIPDGTSAILGHFKFSQISDLHKESGAHIVTWVRDPVERIISNYFFFIKRIRSEKVPHNYYRRNETLIEYASREGARNRMSKFLDGISLKDLLFAGITEHFSDDIMDLAGLLGWKEVKLEYRNVNKEFRSQFEPVSVEEKSEIMRLNEKDFDIYEEALRLRATRLAQSGREI